MIECAGRRSEAFADGKDRHPRHIHRPELRCDGHTAPWVVDQSMNREIFDTTSPARADAARPRR
jgi:hypothetical protein